MNAPQAAKDSPPVRGLAALAPLALACLGAACTDQGRAQGPYGPAAEVAGGTDQVFPVPRPPLSEGIFPCSDCHDPELLPANPERRELRVAHQEIALHHDEEHRWCLDCHDAENRDHLRLASGHLVPFEESYRLCGQCHGDKFRDWRAGVHGRRTGSWDGEKSYLLCVHCHDAHSPRFKPIEPEPPPIRPERTP